VFVGDNRTFSVTFATPVGDDELRSRLLDPATFEQAAYAYADNLFTREFPPTSSTSMALLSTGSTLNRTQTVSVLQKCVKAKKPGNDAQLRAASQACWNETNAKYKVAYMGVNMPERKLVQDPSGRLIPVIPKAAAPGTPPKVVFERAVPAQALERPVATQQMKPAPGPR